MLTQREQAMLEVRNKIKDAAKRTIFVRFQKEGIHMLEEKEENVSFEVCGL